ncbi:BlaI/MecI/CopY family transcriptional regulator [Papillibacter cinnamivorans]|uniref:Predicted transcriptional regulator n=1 Tax=Papillibacter cinnamivorans DSM 12816 TaxID=1122930 RepID=A0A1W1YN83_9FIRM|nr:BlaI/MecI/CopY family transcriptional regulator [Papillibacter cinnamivorans]SMC37592.1 Predicted transcriptional regulator [Papillibacter cinnamivorans DSM 12816]
MDKEIRRLGDAELEIMQAIWAAGGPVNSAYIQGALKGRRDWALSTLLTALNRLRDKGFLSCGKQGWSNLYTPLIGEADYRQSEGRTLLEKLYGNSVTGLVASLVDGNSVGEEDLKELRRMLDQWEERK